MGCFFLFIPQTPAWADPKSIPNRINFNGLGQVGQAHWTGLQ